MHLKRLTLLLAFFAMKSLAMQAQPVATPYPIDQIGGRTYLVSFPDTVSNAQDSRFRDVRPERFELMIYSAVTQDVQIGRVGGAGSMVRVKAGEVTVFDTREVAVPFITVWNRPDRGRVLLLRAQNPVVVYSYMTSAFGTSASTLLPVEAWGTEYYAASWPESSVRNIYPADNDTYDASERRGAPAEIQIIAAYDSTVVRIDPTDSLAECSRCERVTLQKGEAYLVQSPGDTNAPRDIAGTRITASKPIGVLSANTRLQIEPFNSPILAGNSPQDMTAEWLRPTYLHGTEFVFLPFMDVREVEYVDDTDRRAEYIRVFPTAGAVSGLVKETTQGTDDFSGVELASGAFFGDRITDTAEAYLYRTSGPAQAFQVPEVVAGFNTVGSTTRPGTRYSTWGSAMTEMIPRERWTSFAPFRTPKDPVGMRHYLNIVADSADVGEVTIRGNVRDPKEPVFFDRVVPGSSLRWTVLELQGDRTYLLEGPDSIRFSGFVYGVLEGEEIFRETPSGNPLNPAEYEELVAKTYAFSLPGTQDGRKGLPNVLMIDSVHRDHYDCDQFDVTLSTDDLLIHGLEYFRLDPTLSSNVTQHRDWDWPEDSLEFIETGKLAMFVFATYDEEPMRVVIRYRQNHPDSDEKMIVYNYVPPIFSYPVKSIALTSASFPVDTSVVLYNTTPSPIDLITLTLKRETGNAWEILRTEPWIEYGNDLSMEPIAPGDSVIIYLRYSPNELEYNGADLVVRTACFWNTIRLDASRGSTLGLEGEEVPTPSDLDLSRWSPLRRTTPTSSSATPLLPRSADDRGRLPRATVFRPDPFGPNR